jgi:predicted transcriptional regulator
MDHLEVLLQLKDAPEPMTKVDIAKKTKRPDALIEVAVEDLCNGGLITETDGPAGVRSFKYNPQSQALRTAVEELALMYNERPVTLVRAIYDRPASPVTSFAEAFRVRGGRT